LLMLYYARLSLYFSCNCRATTEIYTLSLHDALPIWIEGMGCPGGCMAGAGTITEFRTASTELKKFLNASTKQIPPKELEEIELRSEEHTSELQSRFDLVCRLLLEKKKKKQET